MRTPWGDTPGGAGISIAEQYDFLRTRVSRRGLLAGAALLSASPMLLRTGVADAAVPMGPRWLSFGDDPQTAMTVGASIPGSFVAATVEYGVDTTFGASIPLDVQGVAGVSTVYGAARLTGLTPGSSYFYRVRVDNQTTNPTTFVTAPDVAGPFTFTAFGDEGTTSAAATVVGQIARIKPQVHLLAGDLCYADGDGHGTVTTNLHLPIWDKWLRLIEPAASQIPWMTTVGNHEMEPGFGAQGYDGYLARFAVPDTGAAGCPATYHFRYGSVAFVQVDSNEVSYEIPHNLGYSTGAQDTWLDSVLSGYRQPGSGVDFIVVSMHHCAYSTNKAHGSEGGIRDRWVRLFDQYGVDLVISGHNHAYERTHPLRAGVVVKKVAKGGVVDSSIGTTYLTVGGGGAGTTATFLTGKNVVATSPGKPKQTLPANWSARKSGSFCYAVGEVTPSSATSGAILTIKVFNRWGNPLDNLVLTRAAPPPPPVVMAAPTGVSVR